MSETNRKPPQVHPLRRESDHTPRVPPAGAARKRKPGQLVDMKAAVTGSLKHFLLDATKRRLLRDWLRGITERELQKIYTDPLFGSPKREQIEAVVREQVLLRISRKEAA